MRRTRTRGVLLGLVAGAATLAITEAFRPRPGVARLVDWEEVGRRAKARLPDDRLGVGRKRDLAAYFDRLATELEPPLLEAVGGLPAGTRLPPFQALGRHDWLDLNLEIMSRTLEPLMEVAQKVPNTRIVDLSRAGLDRYVAFLLAFLGKRVLGQFDPQLLGREPLGELELAAPWGLYLIEANIKAWEEEASLPSDELHRWLILHELTHAWQFAAHPWLRSHLNGMLQELIGLAGDERRDVLSRLLSLTVGLREQWGLVRRMQAAMTMIEGYSNLVMNLVGRRLLPGFERLEGAYRERSGKRSPLEDLFWRVTGLELKMQQYHRGEAFCSQVHDRYGMPALNRAWEGPETLPRLDEFDDPEAWYRRVSTRPHVLPPAG